MTFTPGWSPFVYQRCRARLDSAGVRFLSVRADAPTPQAWSIPRFRHLEQGKAGTCWVHSATATSEDFAKANGYAPFPICRMLIGYEGKRLEGGGNPTNGGCPTDALWGMTASKGVGIADESLWPYSDDWRSLGQSPPAAVLASARAFHLTDLVDVPSDDDARRLLAANHPISTGHWWPYQWDRQGATLVDWIGPGTFGHALEECGYAAPGVFKAGDPGWFQIRNWHGNLYAPLSPELAKLVPNYTPLSADATDDFWVRADVYATVRGYGGAERVSVTDLDGFPRLFTLAGAIAL